MSQKKEDLSPSLNEMLLKATEEKEREKVLKTGGDGFFNVKTFTANSSCLLFGVMVMFSYGIGAIRTLEKRFGLSSTQLNFVMSMHDIVTTILVILIGFVGGKIHKPRVIAVSMIVFIIGTFMYSSLYFLNKTSTSEEYETSVSMQLQNNDTLSAEYSHDSSADADMNLCNLRQGMESSCSIEDQRKREADSTAYNVLLIASLLTGVGGSTSILGIAYVDENVKKDTSALYIGIFTSMYAWGPIVGFSLAALCTRYPEDLSGYLQGRVKLGNPEDPNFIGCWWLGYVVVGIFLLIALIPMFFFPKHLQYYHLVKSKTRKTGDYVNKTTQEKLKEFPRLFCRLMSNIPYLVTLASTVCAMYVIVGLIINMPRYIEIHFGLPAYLSNLVAAMGSALSSAVGNIIGGIIMKRFRIRPLGAAILYVLAVVIGAVGSGILMGLGCDQPTMAASKDRMGKSLDLSRSCNTNCSCSLTEMNPICHEDMTYFSPCHAGCNTYDNGTYMDCTCLGEGIAPIPGICKTTCGKLIPYVVVFFVISFLGAMGRVPVTILKLRVVGDELKTLALGVSSALINILTFVPGQILFGTLIDSTCLIWQTSCGKTGNCLFYNIVSFRLLLHGTTLAFQVASLIFAVIILVMVHRNRAEYDAKYEDVDIKRGSIVKMPQEEKLMSYKPQNNNA